MGLVLLGQPSLAFRGTPGLDATVSTIAAEGGGGIIGASGEPAVLALPSEVVWAYDGTRILRSTDGGASWTPVFPTWQLMPTSLQVTGAFFLTASDAWAETEHQWPAQPGVTTTWETTDGGATWHQGTSLPGGPSYATAPAFDEFAFADAEHGFGFGVGPPTTGAGGQEHENEDYLWATSTGGRQWRLQSAIGLPWEGSTYSVAPGKDCSTEAPLDLTVASPSTLFLEDAGCPTTRPGIWRSGNGGKEWAPVRLPAPPGGWPAAERWAYPGLGTYTYHTGASQAGAEVVAMRFFGGRAGVLAVSTRPGELLVYRSGNSGATWYLSSVLHTASLSRPTGFFASKPGEWELPAPAGLYVTCDGGRHWALRRSRQSLSGMTETSFSSPQSGLGFASGPAVGLANTGAAGLRTSDGGRSWVRVQLELPAYPQGEIPFGAVDFVNAKDGWVGGTDGVESTSDGGATWSAQLTTPGPVEELSFAGPETGWALTSDELFSTDDGGVHWSAVPEPPLGAISSVQLVSRNFGVGVICGQQGGTRVLVTEDQGQNWQPLLVPVPDDLACESFQSASTTATPGICFGTPQVGWALLGGYGPSPALLERTSDGGSQWAVVASVADAGQGGQLACEGTADAWLSFNWLENMAVVGYLAGTTDAGRTWQASVRPASNFPFSVPRLEPADGTTVGALGAAQAPANVLSLPVDRLAAPAPGAAVELWENYDSCTLGFGLAITSDGGTSWAGSPDEPLCSRRSQHNFALAHFDAAAVPGVQPSFSFLDAEEGFVLGPLRESPGVGVTMGLVGTSNAGESWQLLARFTWRAPIGR